jgi:16S rRNA (cytosine967-C5)-methyltransferase
MINARTLAFQILLHMDQKVSHPDRLIRSVLARHSRLDERDRALLTELVYGVQRWRDRLDWHIDQLSKIKPKRIGPAVRILLRLALYQILFLDRIPSHAAVNETLNIAKSSQPKHVVGFMNGVLREAGRRQGEWNWPSPEADPVGYIGLMTSHPHWFVRKFLPILGYEETLALCQANNSIAPMALRVNELKASPSQVSEWLSTNGFQSQPSPYLPFALRVSSLRQDIAHLPIHQEGWVQVQDEASQMISLLVAPRPGERILDLCAGFGGKSTHLAALMGNAGDIVSVDKSAWKLEELQENARRQGAAIISTLAADGLELTPDECGLFDRVLLDAPCSGFGSLRRNPDIKWRRHPKDPYRFSQIQKAVLRNGARFVKEGGVLVYATCTVFPEENEEVAKEFSDTHAGWILEPAGDVLPESSRSVAEGPFLKSWPHRHGIDGFFGARWRRPADG